MAKRPDIADSKKHDRNFSPNYFRSPVPWNSTILSPSTSSHQPQPQPPPQFLYQQPQIESIQPEHFQQPHSVRTFMSPTVESVRSNSVQSPVGSGIYHQQPSGNRSPYVIYDEEEHAGPTTAEIIANQSQDYIDEKLAEFQLTILQLQDEQERVQKKTFVNWINSYLCKRSPPLRIEDLINDLKDGVKLLALLEVLSGEKLPTERGKVLRRPHFLSNANTALQFLVSKKIKLVNINPADLVDGKPSIILGLVWTIILYFQIEENTRGLQYVTDSYGNSNTSLESISSSKQENSKLGAKKALLDWVNGLLRNSNVPVRDFGPSWRDGKAFMATIDNLKPHQIQQQELNAMSNRDRLDMAFKLADHELGIPSLLDPIDVDVENPDERSIMTYVGQFLHKYPIRKHPPEASHHDKLKQIQQWLAQQNSEYKAMNGRFPTITQLELYTCAVTIYEEKLELFKVQKVLPENNELVRSIDHAFGDMETHLRNWFSQLVMVNLPEEFSGINKWLYQADVLARDLFTPTIMNEETASIISKKLEDHKKFFATIGNVEQSFSSLQMGHDWNAYQRALIDILANRLVHVSEKAKQRRIYLKFLEHKCCLIAFLNLVESKINQVRSKTYEETLDSFRNMENFVSKNRIVHEFGRALDDMKQVIQEYKIDGSDGGLEQAEASKVDKFLYDTECRWKSVHSKLICSQSMLAEVLAYWEKWQVISAEFLHYLNEADKHISNSKNISFFGDITNWVKRFDQLTECYQFLTTINGSASSDHRQDIDQIYHNISSRWSSVNSSGRKLISSQYVSANREKYDAGVKNLTKWIKHAEQTLNEQPSNYKIEDIQNYGSAVMQIQTEIDDIEELFKHISSTLQELIPDLTRESVDQMMRQLKTEKEALVKVRAMIPIKLHLYHQLLAQKENLEKGLAEIEKWLDQGEKLLGTYGTTSDRETILQQLDQHKHFFGRIVYYKSMLESKNKLSAHINSSLGANVKSDENTTMHRMQQINSRFTYVVTNAINWEQKLKDLTISWKGFIDCERNLSNWFRHAEHYFQNISSTSTANDLEIQKQFFDSFDERWLQEFESCTADLIKLSSISVQMTNCSVGNNILQRVESIRNLDSATKLKIPIHMLRLEYTKNQEVMKKSLKFLEKILTSEEQNFSSGTDIDILQQRVIELKNSDSSMFCQTEYLLKILENIAQNYMNLNTQPQQPQDTLLTTHNNLCLQWENICRRLTTLENNISQTKSEWGQYRQNFTNIISWMDRVDKALEGILKEVNSEEEFKQEKVTFQDICSDADTKREDMQWLVKTLDHLTNYTSQEETTLEQNRLENLISRYKNLIPVVEITMVKTEVFSKCYSYKREVNEIVNLLRKVKEKTSNLPSPLNIHQLVSLIDEQQYTMNQLEKQRVHVISMVQRGKDLSKDVHAPEFILAELKSLETGWNDTFNASFEKLNKLKATHHVWQQYIASKSELSTFFNEAERELRSVTPLQCQPMSVLNDIQMKKGLENQIENSLKASMHKIEELQTKLMPLVSLEQQLIIQKEIDDDQNRLDNILDHVKHRVKYLEDYNNKWKEYKSRLDELYAWAAKIARQELEYIKTSIQSPDERLARINEFKVKLDEQLKQLNVVNEIGQKLNPKEGNQQEAEKLHTLSTEVYNLLNELQQNINCEEIKLTENIAQWNELNSLVSEIKVFLESANTQTEELNAWKAQNFDEVDGMKQKLAVLISNCNVHIDNLQSVVRKPESADEFPENLENLLCKLQMIRDICKASAEKCNKLESNLKTFDTELLKLQSWYTETSEAVDALIQADKNDELAYNDQISKLKTFASEIDASQVKFIHLFQIVNTLCHSMAASLAQAGNSELYKIKTDLKNLSDRVAAEIDKSSKLLNIRQGFIIESNKINDWIPNMRHLIENVDYVDTRSLQDALFSLTSYAKDIKVKNAELEQMTNQHPNEIICKTLTANMYELVNFLKNKENVLKEMINFIQWRDNINEKIEILKRQDSIENTQLADQLKQSISEWKEKVITIENNPVLHAKTEETSLFSPIACVWDMEKQYQDILEAQEAKRNERELLNDKKNEFENNKRILIDMLNEQKKRLEDILKEAPDISNIEQLICDLRLLSDLVDQNRSVKEKLHFCGGIIIREDAKYLPYIQDALNTLDKEWDNLKTQTNDILQTYIELQYALQEFITNRNEFIEDSQVILADLKTVEKFQNKDDLLRFQRKLHKYNENIKNCDDNLDHIEKTGNIINQIFSTIEKPSHLDIIAETKTCKETVVSIKQQIDQQSETLVNNFKQLEEIELLQDDIYKWLSDIKKYMINALNQTTEMEYARISLSRYRDELPAFQQIQCKIVKQIHQLKEQNMGYLPNCLETSEQNLVQQFGNIKNISEQLEQFVSNYILDETQLKTNIFDIKNKVNKLRDSISKCDDLSGESEKIIEKLTIFHQIQNDIAVCGTELTDSEKLLALLTSKYTCLREGGALPRELAAIKARYDKVVTNSATVKNNLTSYLKKMEMIKVAKLQTIITDCQDKLKWCIPEKNCDNHNINMKVECLNDITKSLKDAEEEKQKIMISFSVLTSMFQPSEIENICVEKDKVFKELEQIKKDHFDHRNTLTTFSELQQKFIQLSFATSASLKESEDKLKSEANYLSDLNTLSEKIQKTKHVRAELDKYEPSINELQKLYDEIESLFPSIVPKQIFDQIQLRHDNLIKTNGKLLQQLLNCENKYIAYTDEIQSFIQAKSNFEAQSQDSLMLPESDDNLESTIENINFLKANLHIVEKYLNNANGIAETIYNEITPDCRKMIRNQLAAFKNELIILNKKIAEKSTAMEKKIMHRKSIIEQIKCIKNWLQSQPEDIECNDDLLYSSLQSKKSKLSQLKLYIQDINANAATLKEVEQKNTNCDEKSKKEIQDNLKIVNKLAMNADKKLILLQNYIQNHESYDLLLEKTKDAVYALAKTTEQHIPSDEAEMAKNEERFLILENIINTKDSIEVQLEQCQKYLDLILTQTHLDGHETLKNPLNCLQIKWQELIEKCTQELQKIKENKKNLKLYGDQLQLLSEWITKTEKVVKDTTLKGSLELKKKFLAELKSIANLLSEKIQNINTISNEMSKIVTPLTGKLKSLDNRLQNVNKLNKDMISKYEQFVQQHEHFNQLKQKFSIDLDNDIQLLEENKNIIGDLQILKGRSSQIRELTNKRIKDVLDFEKLFEDGEKVCLQTNSEGSSAIRQQLKTLKTKHDELLDNLNIAAQRLEECLIQFEEFSSAQEQLSKWLNDIEKVMRAHIDLKTTLSEKRLQLQNHKIMHNEMLLQNTLVNSVCDKAQHLVEQTKDPSLTSYVNSIKELFSNIIGKSEGLLENLEHCLDAHTSLNNATTHLRNWINENQQSIAHTNAGLPSDKNEIKKHIKQFDEMRDKKDVGKKLMDAIDEKFLTVSQTTSQQGCLIIKGEIETIRELLAELFAKIDENVDNCKQELKEYEQFEKKLEELTRWCKVQENIFKNQELITTINEKETQYNKFKNLLTEILNLEKNIDNFLEQCATLMQKSGIEKIKNLSNQLSNRYQLLQVLAKEVVKRAQNIYENHKKYDEKLQNTQSMLNILELELDKRSTNDLDMDQMREKLANCDINIHNVMSISETVLPETTASGREVIRQQIKEIKGRYDEIFNNCKDIANKAHVEALQRAACQELSEQLIAWLQSMELNLEKKVSVASLQECRGNSVMYKSYLHDILAQNRQISTLKDKLSNLQTSINIESIELRFTNAKLTCETMLENLDTISQLLSKYADLYKTLDDNQKHLWNMLSSFSIMGANKSNMQQKLSQLHELDNISIHEPKLMELKLLIEENSKSNLLADSMATKMKSDFDTLNNEYIKLRLSLDNITQQINDSLRKWDDYQTVNDTLKFWLETTEDKLKHFNLCDNLEDKETQYQQLMYINNEVIKKETNFETLSDQISELSQISSIDVPTNRQLNQRFQTVKATAKEILKKCEHAVNVNKIFEQKSKDIEMKLSEAEIIYNQQLADINSNDSAVLGKQLQKAADVMKNGQLINNIFDEINEINEILYVTSNPKGQELIANKINKLQKQYEELFDKIRFQKKLIDQKLTNISEFKTEIEKFRAWLHDFKDKLGDSIKLQDTLDAKINQQQEYDELNQCARQQQKDLLTLKQIFENISMLPNNNNTELNMISKDFEITCNNSEQYETLYVKIVNDHQNYCKAVMELQEFLEAAANTVDLCSDLDLDRVSLYTNLERLINFQKSLSTELETALINQISQLGEVVIPNTAEDGQINIRAQIDSSQQEWEALVQLTQNTIKTIEDRIQSWNNYDKAKDTYSSWMRDVDSKVHAIDLKPTLSEKQDQLSFLKHLQGEIKAKELEIDDLTERVYALQKGISIGSKTPSLIPDLYVKYQQVLAKIQKMVNQWTGYCNDHHQFNEQVQETKEWLDVFKRQLDFCSNPNITAEKDLREKRSIINNLIASKEEGSNKIQIILESASNTISNTASDGHDAINVIVNGLNAQWSQLTLKIIEVKSNLDNSVHQWAGFLDQVQNMKKAVDWLRRELKLSNELKASFSEKRTALEHLRTVEEKARSEIEDVIALKPKMNEMINLGLQTPATIEAQEIIETVEDLAKQIIALCKDREDQYRDHRIFKEAFEDLQNWLCRAREKFALVQEQSLNNRLNCETTINPLQAMLNKKPQGELLLEQVHQNYEIVIASTSDSGKSVMRQDMKNIKEIFDTLFKDIQIQKEVIENAAGIYRSFKDDLERFSEWLQQMDILVKNNKLALLSNKDEKLKKVEEMKEVLQKIETGRVDIEKINKFAEPLLKTHLASQTQAQLRQINSRYEVQLNLGKDVLSKVENNYEEHKTFEQLYDQAKSWINNAKDVIRQAIEAPSDVSKEILEKRLQEIQLLLSNKSEGQSLLHNTINFGEKILRNTKSDGKDVINGQLKDLQSDWDRCMKKMSAAKVQLETSILQWADYNSKYNHLTQWIRDREMKLTQVTDPQKAVKQQKEGHSKLSSGLNEKKANLQFCDDIVQDIVSFEPMIQSVTSKALHKTVPVSDISSKYATLSKQAKEIFEKQKEAVNLHQNFIDAGSSVYEWIRNSRDIVNKHTEPSGDKEKLIFKLTHVQKAEDDIENGQKKLENALKQGELACRKIESEEKEMIEQEVAILQEEFDNYVDFVKNTKSVLESGIVKWAEYENKYKDAIEWLTNTDKLVQTYNHLQSNLDNKKRVLEEFQVNLQDIFDWQRVLDNLNPVTLLEICADTRISNGITQLTTKYNALLSHSKEVMKRLELYYQEHQQHNTLYEELINWIDKLTEKLNTCKDSMAEHQPSQIQTKLNLTKSIKQSLEHGQNKLRYLLELKEKVIINTESAGAAKIDEDTENLKQEYEKLQKDLNSIKVELMDRLTQFEEIIKMNKILKDWINEVEVIYPNEIKLYNDLTEKKSNLEKLRAIEQEMPVYDEIVDKIKNKMIDFPVSDNCEGHELGSEIKKYADLRNNIANYIENLENQVNNHEKFKCAYNEIIDWIKQAHLKTEKSSDSHGDRAALISRLSKLHEIELSFSEGKILLENANDLSVDVINTTKNEGQDIIKEEVRYLKSEWDSLYTNIQSVNDVLNTSLRLWNSFIDKCESMHQQLNNLENKIKNTENTSINQKENLAHCKLIFDNMRDNVETLNEICETLTERSGCSKLRDRTVKIQNRYLNLLTRVQDLTSKSEKKGQSYTDFLEKKSDFENWLKISNNTLSTHSNHELDEKRTRNNYEVINALQNKFSSGEKLIAELQENYKKILFAYPDDEHLELQEAFSQAQDSWNNYLLCIQTVCDNLKLKLRQWEIFNENKRNFINWLNDATSKLNETTESSVIELSDMKAKLERIRNLKKNIDDKKYDLNELNETVVKISKDQALEEYKQLEQDYSAIKQKCGSKINELEQDIEEFSEYNNNLQEIEKWLLQMSFQLMAHNSLYIMNTSQALEQISQHDYILTNIENFQQNIDQLKNKGLMVVERFASKSSHNIQYTIDIQLTNIQESYNSLLNTSMQIKNRLLESLKKFQEYESTLANIDKKLDGYEISINDLLQKTSQELEEAQCIYSNAQDIYKKLLEEKEFLAAAVHSYEAAKACISRPSSPLDAQSQLVPEKELLTRARLEDCLDQIHSFLTDFALAVEKLEHLKQQKDDMLKWMATNKLMLNDLSTSPGKLHQEAANQEIKQLKEFLQELSDSRKKIVDYPNEDINEAERLLDEMKSQATDILLKKQKEQATIDEYRKIYDATQHFMNEQNKSMDLYEKGCKHSLDEKITKVSRIRNDTTQYFDNQLPKLVEMGKQINVIVNNIDKNQVNEQQKSMDKRFHDLQNRIDRQLNALESTKNHFNALQTDLIMESSWVNNQFEEVTSINPDIFTDSKSVEEHLQKNKTILREIESKSLSLGSYANRIMTLEKEMEKSEVVELEQKLKQLQKNHDSLGTQLNGINQKLIDALNKHKTLEADIESAKNHMEMKTSEIQRQLAASTHLPLLCSNVDIEIIIIEKLEVENEEFRKKSLVNIEWQVDEIINTALNDDPSQIDPNFIKKMESYKHDLAQQWDLVSNIIGVRKEILQKNRIFRDTFEREAKKLKSWMDETDTTTEKLFFNPIKKINLLMDQKLYCEKLMNEYISKESILEILKENASKISPTVSDADRKVLDNELKSIQKRFKKRKQVIKEKIESLDENVTKMQTAFSKIQQCLETMKQVKDRINTASSDTTCSTEKINNLLSIYENSLQLLRDQKLSVASIANFEIPDISSILQQLEEMIREIEKLLDRLKYLLGLRSEFIAAVNMMVQLIQKRNLQVATIEGSIQMDHKQKCYEYEKLRDEMNDCNQLLQTAKEKGQQIVACGSDIDKNNVDGQTKTLDEQVEQLKQIIFNNLKAHQDLYNVEQKLSKNLKDNLKWFDDEEGNIQLLPTFKINKKQPNFVISLIKDHEKLQVKANERLDTIRKIVEKLKEHAPNDIMPEELSMQVSQAQKLLIKIPQDVTIKTSFLNDCLGCRKQFQNISQELDIWISNAEKKLPGTLELNFNKIKHLLDCHKQFFYPKTEKQLLKDIEDTGNKVAMSMSAESAAVLIEEIENYKQSVNKLVTMATAYEHKLEQADEDFQKYNSILDKINTLLSDESIKRWEGKELVMRDLADVKQHIETINHTIDYLAKNKHLIEIMNEISVRLTDNTDSKNTDVISNQTVKIESDWTHVNSNLQKILEHLEKLSTNWHEFDKLVMKITKIQSSLINDFDKIDDKKVESLGQLLSDKQKIVNFQEKLQLSKPIRSTIAELLSIIHPHSLVTNEQIVRKLDEDNDKLHGIFDAKLKKLNKEMERIKENIAEIDSMKQTANELFSKVNLMDPYEKFNEKLDQEFVSLEQICKSLKLNADQMIKSISKTFLDVQNFVPSDLQCELDSLQMAISQLMVHLNEKNNLFQKAKQIRQKFLDSLSNLKLWLENSELKIENQNYPLEEKKEITVLIRDEFDTIISEDFKNILSESNLLKESCCENDAQDISRMLQEVTAGINNMEKNIRFKYDQVENGLDLRRKFLIYYNDILEWAAQVEDFSKKPLHCQSIKEIKSLCEKYTPFITQLKNIESNLSEMNHCLDLINEIACESDLKIKMEEVEGRKNEIETVLMENNTLLQETLEEWEQCSKKINSVDNYITCIKTTLVADDFYERPLRDQLVAIEKILADLNCQNTKIEISSKKLNLHFQCGIQGIPDINETAENVQNKLSTLIEELVSRKINLDEKLDIIDKYQQEVHQLKQNLTVEEVHLRQLMHKGDTDPEADSQNIDVVREKVENIQNKILNLVQLIKHLTHLH